MNKQIFQADILQTIKFRGIFLRRLAIEAGVEKTSLWSFMNKPARNLMTDNFFRLWTHIYGNQNPVPLYLQAERNASPEK